MKGNFVQVEVKFGPERPEKWNLSFFVSHALIWAVAILFGIYGYGLSGLRASLFDAAEIESQIVAWILFLGSPLLAAYLWRAAPKQT